MLRRSTRVLLLWPLAFGLVGTRSAAAETDQAGARELFAEGRRLAAAEHYAEACPKFEESFRSDPGIGTNFNLADCLEHTGRTASAWARFLDVAAATKASGQTDRERVARARAAALEPKLAHVIIDVVSAVPGLVVQRNGGAVSQASWGISMPVDPGEQVVQAWAPLKKRWSTSVTVPLAGGTVSVSIPALEDAPNGRAAGPNNLTGPLALAAQPTDPMPLIATPPPTISTPSSRWTGTMIALVTVGAAGLATGAVFAIEFESMNGDAKKICPTSMNCLPAEKTRHDSLAQEAHDDRTLAFVGAGVGGAAVAAAAYLWWKKPRFVGATRRPSQEISAAPLASRRGLGARLEWRW